MPKTSGFITISEDILIILKDIKNAQTTRGKNLFLS